MRLFVIKIGGALLDDQSRLDSLLDQIATAKDFAAASIIVHGGGRALTEFAARLGIESSMVQGRRITDQRMRDLALMVYGGLINRTLVAALQSRGCNAIGMTGADANIITATKQPVRDEIDFGFVGDIDQVNTIALNKLLQQGFVPVIAPLTHDACGTLFNTNADSIAASVASSLSKEWEGNLLLCFEREGVWDGNKVIRCLTFDEYHRLRSEGFITDGMLPKLDTAFAALQHGVKRTCILQPEDVASVMRGGSAGTELQLESDRR